MRGHRADARSMRAAVLLLILFILAFPAFAQSASEQILRAKQLREEGQPKAAIAILEPLTRRQALTENELAGAWDLLASSYQDLEMLEQAKAAYENAIALTSIDSLGREPRMRRRWRSWIGGRRSGTGGFREGLCEKSMHIYEALGNSAGIAITVHYPGDDGGRQERFQGGATFAGDRASSSATHQCLARRRYRGDEQGEGSAGTA